MTENSKIQWTTHSFNPWIGCTKVSPGCQNCYAERLMAHRLRRVEWRPHGTREVTSDDYWQLPMRWERKARKENDRPRVFCASVADVFEDRVELYKPRRRLFELIERTPSLNWLILTKRPHLRRELMPIGKAGKFYDNVWWGTSAEDQQRLDQRAPHLRHMPGTVRFLSLEPLLGPLDLSDHLDAFDWAIVGGESGPGARPMDPEWMRGVVTQCRDADIPVFVKQMGSHGGTPSDARGDLEDIPEDLRLRQFPRHHVPAEVAP